MQASELQNKFERIRANKWFEAFVISVIVISALLVGAKTYELAKASEKHQVLGANTCELAETFEELGMKQHSKSVGHGFK